MRLGRWMVWIRRRQAEVEEFARLRVALEGFRAAILVEMDRLVGPLIRLLERAMRAWRPPAGKRTRP
jgi:hypothetical protein